jgi:hypothetical protein
MKRTIVAIGLLMLSFALVGCRVSNPAATSDDDTLLPSFDFGGVPAQSEPIQPASAETE